MRNEKRVKLKESISSLRSGDVIVMKVRNYDGISYDRIGVFEKYQNSRLYFTNSTYRDAEDIHITRIDEVKKYEEKLKEDKKNDKQS